MDTAFSEIKRLLTTAPTFVLPNFSLLFKLHLDALKLCIGVKLSQNERLVAYFSEKLAGANLRYKTYAVEFYAVL